MEKISKQLQLNSAAVSPIKSGALFALLLFAAAAVTGCGRPTVKEKAQINIPIYQKMEYKTVEVGKGDLEPKLEFTIRVDEFKRISYNVENDSLELEKLHVTVGDKVKKGDVLISFKSGDIEENIKEYEKQLADDALLLEHYKRMQALVKKAEDKDADADEEVIKSEQSEYSVSIKDLKREMELLKVRIAEEKEKLKQFSIVAEEDGTISFVDENLNFGYVLANTSLVSQTCGSEYYEATVKDDYDFQIGDIFKAVSGVAEYEMELISVESEENHSEQTSPETTESNSEQTSPETTESNPEQTSPETTESNSEQTSPETTESNSEQTSPESERTLLFRPKQDMSGVSEADTFTITIKKEVLRDVLYVPSRCISKCTYESGDKYFVFVIDENGFREGVEVTPGAVVGEGPDEITVITSGLTGGERVMIR